MDIIKIFEDELKKELQEKLSKYENKIYLSNEDIMHELSISSLSNLRKQISQGLYQGLYEEKKSKKEHFRWNKFRFFKWYYQQKLEAINLS